MILRINKIKKLGLVFSDYERNANLGGSQLPDFKHYNLIYGWTGSGKTTLSRLFDVIETGDTKNLANLEYEIEGEANVKCRQHEAFGTRIKVFNQDFIDSNISIQEGKAKAIKLILGDANKTIVEQIAKDTEELKQKNEELKAATEELERKKKARGIIFTDIARTIYVAITGGAIRNYRKDNAETDFLALQQRVELSQEDLEKYALVVKQSSKPAVEQLAEITFPAAEGKTETLTEVATNAVSQAKVLVSRTVESQVINRLKENPEISSWVEEGLSIHAANKSVTCEFCGQPLPNARLSELYKHFSEADKVLKQNIDDATSQLSKICNSIENTKYPDKARLYDELQPNYEEAITKFDKAKIALLSSIKDIESILNDKKAKTTQSVELNNTIDTIDFSQQYQTVSAFIVTHNKKTADFENEKAAAVQKLKIHYLSTIHDEVVEVEKEIGKIELAIKLLQNGDITASTIGTAQLEKRISENQVKISSTHKACEEINRGLATFLGRSELIFTPNKIPKTDDKGRKQEIEDGYAIKRNGVPAKNLSQGEKTAIAFVYFTIHLREQGFDINNGIVVIDDPISSLDSSSLFQAFAFLKNAVKDAKEIFIFIHNFDFLKLLLNWVKHDDHGRRASYYMIKNCHINGNRCAYLDKMDKELSEYESEYHYLFKKLVEFESDGTIAQSYPIPNLARKVLDTFLMFRVPSGDGTYKKLEKLGNATGFDENKWTAIYKFVNDQSHITGAGFDPALVPETQKNAKYLLEMIAATFPEHYAILQESIK